MDAPANPAGVYVPETQFDSQRRDAFIEVIENAPAELRAVVRGLTDGQLETRYRNWTIRQIVNHLADSHVNSYIRFKWTLTEDHPTIKPYNETRWADLADSHAGNIETPLALFEGLHARWVHLMRSMSPGQFERTFYHPESGQSVSLNDALAQYAWHSLHHTAQIRWLRDQRGW